MTGHWILLLLVIEVLKQQKLLFQLFLPLNDFLFTIYLTIVDNLVFFMTWSSPYFYRIFLMCLSNPAFFYSGGSHVPCFSLSFRALRVHQERVNIFQQNQLEFEIGLASCLCSQRTGPFHFKLMTSWNGIWGYPLITNILLYLSVILVFFIFLRRATLKQLFSERPTMVQNFCRNILL